MKKSSAIFFVGLITIFWLTACSTPATTPAQPPSSPTATHTSVPPTETPTDTPPEPTPVGVDTQTIEVLRAAVIPEADPYENARRFRGLDDVPRMVAETAPSLEVGAQDIFTVTNNVNHKSFEVPATLQYVTDHLYFWIEDDVPFNEADLADLARTFESKIYSTNRAFFGSEWSPGVDGDEHIYVLYARNIGRNIAGYFSSRDSINPVVQDNSNGHEMFVFSAEFGAAPLDHPFTRSVLAHEFQHMIHWNQDRNETSWINEGFSEVAQLLNGYQDYFNDSEYTSNPDLQLNDWPHNEDAAPHYGASFLFLAYYLDRFGEDATQALVAHQANGLESIDLVLTEMGITDALKGNSVSADDVVVDWALTNYINDEDVLDGRLAYQEYRNFRPARQTEANLDCAPGVQERDVHQYGVDYIRIKCEDEQVTLRFEGVTETSLLPADPISGQYAFWSNKGDSSHMTLTRSFDFTEVEGPLTFNYWTWYDIEEDWDYAYLTASENGENWVFLNTPSGTDTNPVGNNIGWGLTGLSGGVPEWIEESVDISQFAGKKVQLRFEYLTDDAVNGEGMLIDDIFIPEINYFTDFEADDGGWEAEGFVRVRNVLPQTFRLALIAIGETITVEYLTPGVNNILEIPLDFTGDVEEYVLVVIGTTRYTRSLANYTYEFVP